MSTTRRYSLSVLMITILFTTSLLEATIILDVHEQDDANKTTTPISNQTTVEPQPTVTMTTTKPVTVEPCAVCRTWKSVFAKPCGIFQKKNIKRFCMYCKKSCYGTEICIMC